MSWNLSLVFHQLTDAPFEPIEEASLKHLTFKTVFLLALGSGKAGVRSMLGKSRTPDTSQTGQRCLCTQHPAFFSKNQPAKEGPDSVAPMVIPALAPTLGKSLKSDRSLCPVRVLC